MLTADQSRSSPLGYMVSFDSGLYATVFCYLGIDSCTSDHPADLESVSGRTVRRHRAVSHKNAPSNPYRLPECSNSSATLRLIAFAAAISAIPACASPFFISASPFHKGQGGFWN